MLKVITSNSLQSLQKLYLSSEYSDIQSGQYVLVHITEGVRLICQICTRHDLNQTYCIANKSVVCINELKESNILYGKIDYYCELSSLFYKDLVVVRNVQPFKNITVSVIINNAHLTAKWKSKISVLKNVVREVLKMFVVSIHTVVFTESVSACQNMGIYCIVIHSTDFEYGKVASSTNVCIDNIFSKNWFQTDRIVPSISGVDSVFHKLKDYCMHECNPTGNSAVSQFNFNVLLSGPAGCGKTTMVYCVAKECGFPLLSIVGPELCNPQPGQTEQAMKKIFEEAKLLASEKLNGGCVLLLDQIEALCSINATSHIIRVQSTLMQLLDSLVYSPGVFVVATTDRPDSLSPAIRRPPRFTIELVMGVPTESERKSMLGVICKDVGLNISTDISKEVARWTPGYVAADLTLLVSDVTREISKLADHRDENDVDLWRSCVLRMQPSTLRGELGIVSNTDMKMSDIGGMSFIKKALKKAVEWPFLYQDGFKRLGIPPTKGILLYGPPGCAKTSLVRAIASGLNTTFLAISAAALYSPYVGDSERTVTQLFHRARLGAPTILFIDEIDALVGSRADDTREKGVHERVLSSFLIEMDGVGTKLQKSFGTGDEINKPSVIVIAATNQPQLLDAALLRPGRFDRLIYVGPPERDERFDILTKLTNKIPLADCVDLEHIADITTMFSGADLSRLCKEAGLVAMTQDGMDIEKVRQRHFLSAFHNMKPSLTKNQVSFYKDFNF